jgi:hypothetical protein
LRTPLSAKLVVTAIVGGILLGGCASRKETVVVPAPGPVVVAPAPGPVVVAPNQRVVTYPDGRWELRGGGTAMSPYYWVWIPAGTNPPSPPNPPPLSRQGS